MAAVYGGTILDATGCGQLAELYGLVPNSLWGSTPAAQRDQWTRSQCQPEKICRYWIQKYGITTASWGSLANTALRSSYNSLECARYTPDYNDVPLACTAVAGFTVQRDADKNGTDTSACKWGASPADVGLTCVADVACQCMKTNVSSPLDPLIIIGMCLYTKLPASCPEAAGYTVQADVSKTGSVISCSSVGANAAAASCSADPTCRGWNSAGCTLSDVSNPTAFKGMCLYTKRETTCPGVPGYNALADVEHDLDDIGCTTGGTATDLAASCNATATCVAFTTRGCTKRAASVTNAAPGVCLYTKQSLPVLDATGCGQLAELYGLVPNSLWGSTPAVQQDQWTRSQCQPEKICRYWIQKYGITTASWGSMLDTTLRSSYYSLSCDDFAPIDSGTGGCVDKNDNCPYLAEIGECGSSSGSALTECRRACLECGTAADCSDYNSNCTGWASAGACSTNSWFMLQYCPLSCNSCPAEYGTLDANGCGAIVDTFGLVPAYDWGRTPQPQRDQWTRSQCMNEKICSYWIQTYATSQGSYGQMTDQQLLNSYDALGCDYYAPYEGRLRLVGGSTLLEGRLEIFHSSRWGSVCDDWFYEESAQVACRQLGFATGQAVCCGAYNAAAGTPPAYWLDNVECVGDESSLTQCASNAWGENDCVDSETVGVQCVEDPCNSGPCQNGGTCTPSSDYSTYTCSCGQFWTDSTCGTDVDECATSNGGCDSNADCTNNLGAAPTCTCRQGYIGDGLTCATEGQLRLVGGSFPWEGRLEIFHDSRWGAVCDDGFYRDDARVACRQLGGFSATAGIAVCCGAFNAAAGTPPAYWLDNVLCVGDESSLTQCPSNAWGVNDCSDYEAVGVRCVDDPCDPSPCQNFGTCTPSSDYSTYTCTCDQFWTDSTCGTDVDECATNNGGCDSNADCTNNVGAAPTCTCRQGYIGDGLTCTSDTVCTPVSGYTAVADYDHAGDDIDCSGGDVSTLTDRCNSFTSCVSFNTYGCIKTQSSINLFLKGNCLYTKNNLGTDCPWVKDYNVQPDVDHNLNDLDCNGGSLTDKAVRCNSNGLCVAFNSYGCIKSNMLITNSYPGMCFYVLEELSIQDNLNFVV
ncbi:hypothetical protein HXX76_008482 [Chlamydomonas incerta]|uniref:Uncharacterized protein n=1 Tax=Chlamydomonas incerta TaxID=51695 RepID=A0A835W1C2_CHLIN|nr:hypothetical protein HXX76_008482 [Chlamydomonas incerta]|eukprot:KAG2433424.1 hypothetical protein HXX76_008482 [Chlamydomonas incerta]